MKTIVLLLWGLALVAASDPEECVLELECEECLPESPPLVRAEPPAFEGDNGRLVVPHGQALKIWCAGGRFVAYPLHGTLEPRCEAGRFRISHDNALRHLLELGCQQQGFEDVLHDTSGCAPPLQGRAYRTADDHGAVRHLAALCFDSDAAVARWTQAALPAREVPMPKHREQRGPLSLLGNFNEMFDTRTRHDAERLFGDEARMARRLKEILRHDQVALGGVSLTGAPLLAPAYFGRQDRRVARFPSNLVAAWRSVAEGNLHHVQSDVARLSYSRPVRVAAGTHGVASVRTDGGNRTALYLRGGGRFPVPRFIWTLVVEEGAGEGPSRAAALLVLNDPLVAVSEIRGAMLCESKCSEMRWVREARRQRRFETPLHGLLFCCEAHQLAQRVPEVPQHLLQRVPHGAQGLLVD